MCPYSREPKRFESEAQATLPTNSSPKLEEKGIKYIQQIVGSILYYIHAVNMTLLAALSTIAINQTKATEQTMERFIQLRDYLAVNQELKMRFQESDMILNIHLYAA